MTKLGDQLQVFLDSLKTADKVQKKEYMQQMMTEKMDMTNSKFEAKKFRKRLPNHNAL